MPALQKSRAFGSAARHGGKRGKCRRQRGRQPRAIQTDKVHEAEPFELDRKHCLYYRLISHIVAPSAVSLAERGPTVECATPAT